MQNQEISNLSPEAQYVIEAVVLLGFMTFIHVMMPWFSFTFACVIVLLLLDKLINTETA